MPNALVSPAAGPAPAPSAGPAIGPSPGNALASAAAGGAPDAAAQPEQAAGPQFTLDEVKDTIRKQASVDRKLQGLLAQPKITRDDVVQMAVELIAEKVLSAQAVAGYLADLPDDDPEKVRAWVEGHAKAAEQGLDQLLQFVHGSMGPADPAMAQ